jgi:hypothetical protein
VKRRPHWRKENQCVMNRQQSTSISGKPHLENHKGEGNTPSVPQLICVDANGLAACGRAKTSPQVKGGQSNSARASPVTICSMSRNPFDRGDPARCGVRITLSNASNSSSGRPGSS